MKVDKSKPNLAIDIDDTVVKMTEQLMIQFNRQHGTDFKAEDITNWDNWVGDPRFTDKDFFAEMEHLDYTVMDVEPNAISTINGLAWTFNIFFQTACGGSPEMFVKKANFIRDKFGHHQAYPIIYFDRTELKRFPGFDVVIDDSPGIIYNSNLCNLIILFDKPWNRMIKEAPHLFEADVVRVKTWKEIEELLS